MNPVDLIALEMFRKRLVEGTLRVEVDESSRPLQWWRGGSVKTGQEGREVRVVGTPDGVYCTYAILDSDDVDRAYTFGRSLVWEPELDICVSEQLGIEVVHRPVMEWEP